MVKNLLFSFLLIVTFDNFIFAQVPANDLCTNAIAITCGSTTAGTTINATMDNIPNCGTALVTGPSVWYTFVGTGQAITVNTCTNPLYDTEIGVYTGSCGALTCVGGNDDACGTASEVTLNTVNGTTYYIVVHGYNLSAGTFTLSLTCAAPCSPAVTNDDCATAETLTVFGDDASCTPTLGTNICSTVGSHPNPPCFGQFANAFDVWYEFTTGTTWGVNFEFAAVTGTNFVIALYTSCGTPVVSCLNPNSAVALDTNSTYLLRVLNLGGAEAGTFNICVSADSTALPPPSNDICDSAILINCDTTLIGTTIRARVDSTFICGSSYIPNSPGVWYTYIGTGDAMTLSLCNDANFDTQLGVFTGSCGNYTCVAGNDNAVGCGNTSEVTFNSEIGTTYFILIHGVGGTSGTFTLTTTCSAPCVPAVANDNCSDAVNLTIFGDVTLCTPTSGTNVCATSTNRPNPNCSGNGNVQDVWYTFTNGNAYGATLSFNAISGANYMYALYPADCDTTPIQCNTLPANGDVTLTLLNNNSSYFLQIFNSGGVDEGDFDLCLSADSTILGPAENDECANSIVLMMQPTCNPTDATVLNATQNFPADSCNNFLSPSANDVWFSFVATNVDGSVSVTPMFDPVVEWLDACDGTGNKLDCSDAVGIATEFMSYSGLTIGETYYIRLYAYGTAADPNFNICVYEGIGVNVPEVSEAPRLRVFPNPTNGILNLEYDLTLKGKIIVANNLGQIIKQSDLKQQIDLTGMENGFYHLFVMDENDVLIATEKIIVQ